MPPGGIDFSTRRDTQLEVYPKENMALQALRIPYLDIPREALYFSTPKGMPRPQYALG